MINIKEIYKYTEKCLETFAEGNVVVYFKKDIDDTAIPVEVKGKPTRFHVVDIYTINNCKTLQIVIPGYEEHGYIYAGISETENAISEGLIELVEDDGHDRGSGYTKNSPFEWL